MTDDNSNLVDIPEDLSSFKTLFNSSEAPEPEVEDTEDDALATDEDTDASQEDEAEDHEDSEESEGEDESDDEESDDEDEPEEPEEKVKKPKSRYQERINELTRTAREAQRREAQLLQRLEALEADTRKSTQQQEVKEALPQGAPDPDALDDKGEPKYPLGAYDPDYIKDFTKFTIAQETEALQRRQAEQAAAQQVARAQEELKQSWEVKLEKAEEVNPDIREDIAGLVDTFSNIQPQYGEYLATTIMQCENGPAILEYLSQNIGEAQAIVASGPAAATLAIGRLEAKLSPTPRPSAEEKRNKKPSDAPTPPKATAKGTRGAASVRPDTDNYDAFKREFLSKL